jgi:hypothetical protein
MLLLIALIFTEMESISFLFCEISSFNLNAFIMRTKMKKLLATLCIVGSALSLAACETSSVDSGPGYAEQRTAGAGGEAPADRVFQEKQMK